MISDRYAFAVAILVALAMVPTIIHSYAGAIDKDLLTTSAINGRFGSYVASDTARKSDYIKSTFDSEDWIEQSYTGPDGGNILLFSARSYDHKRLYHHPELGILYGKDIVNRDIINLGDSGDMPARLFNRRTGHGAGAYVLLYDGKFVRNPVKLQLLTSLELLFTPRKMMTLFFVYDNDLPSDADFYSSAAAKILVKSIKTFQTQGQ